MKKDIEMHQKEVEENYKKLMNEHSKLEKLHECKKAQILLISNKTQLALDEKKI